MMESAELYRGFCRFSLALHDDPEPEGIQNQDTWLSAHIEVREDKRAWTAENACLTLAEATTLVAWIESLSRSADKSELSFREANLSFSYEAPELSIHLGLEFAPPHHEGPPYIFVVELDETQATDFSRQLRKQMDGLGKEAPPENRPLIPPSPYKRKYEQA